METRDTLRKYRTRSVNLNLRNSANAMKKSCPPTSNEEKLKSIGQDEADIIKPTVKRYLILLIYGFCQMEKGFQWISLSTITNKVAFYYGVNNIAVNWTSVLLMISFIPMVLPCNWLIGKIGLRKSVLLGSFGMVLGAVIKCFGCDQNDFYIIIWAQVAVAIGEQFIFCIPPRVASVWFPDHQVSIATGLGIFGNQVGIALGFLVPQAVLDGLDTHDEIGVGMFTLHLGTAIVCVVTFVVTLVFFDNQPKYAPGAARLRKIREEKEEQACQLPLGEEMQQFYRVLRELLKRGDFNLLIVAYGVNVGAGYALQTVLNQMVERAQWIDANRIVGKAGLVIIVCGMVGTVTWGHLCDITRKYLLITKVLYLGAVVSMALLGFTLNLYNEYLLYLAAGLLGFHMIGYTVVGLDTTVEITYPVSELASSSLMNFSPQMFGMVIVFASSAIVDAYGTSISSIFLLALLTLGLICNFLINAKLKRQEAIETEINQQNFNNSSVSVVNLNPVKS